MIFQRFRPPAWNEALRRLVTAQVVTVVGTQVTVLALPTYAIRSLHASAFAVAALTTVAYVPFLLGPFVGLAVDRGRLRHILIRADLVRAVALVTVPIAAALGLLTLYQLYLVAAVVGLLTTLFDIAVQATLPKLLDSSHIVTGNAAVSAAQSVGTISGPAVAGLTVQFAGAARAVCADVASYLYSARLLSGLPELPRGRTTPPLTWRAEIAAGFRAVQRVPGLWRMVGGTATMNLGCVAVEALYVLYAYQHGLSPMAVGATYALYSAGMLGGSLATSRLSRRYGLGPMVAGASVCYLAGLTLVPLSSIGSTLAMLGIAQATIGASGTVWGVGIATLRQSLTPPERLGQVTALVRTVAFAAIPLSTLLAGALVHEIGLVPTMWVFVVLAAPTPLWYFNPTCLRLKVQPAIP
jgi:MFS family permease